MLRLSWLSGNGGLKTFELVAHPGQDLLDLISLIGLGGSLGIEPQAPEAWAPILWRHALRGAGGLYIEIGQLAA